MPSDVVYTDFYHLHSSTWGRRYNFSGGNMYMTASVPPIIMWSWQWQLVDSSWNVIAHGDAREEKRRGDWWMEWVASTLHTTSEHGASSITTADAHTSADSSQLNWLPRWFKWAHPFCQETKSGFCACAITFQMQSTGFLQLNVGFQTMGERYDIFLKGLSLVIVRVAMTISWQCFFLFFF